jgi:endonuclease YncB( thermonuclease family)
MVRLLGVDAPELRQTCRRAGEDWRCGMAAAESLRAMVESGAVECRLSGRDRNGRKLGRCRAGRIPDLGERLVRDGWALSYDTSYLDQERAAARDRQGIWTAEFERPRDWRRARRASAAN